MLDIGGVDIPGHMDGRSLLKIFDGADESDRWVSLSRLVFVGIARLHHTYYIYKAPKFSAEGVGCTRRGPDQG